MKPLTLTLALIFALALHIPAVADHYPLQNGDLTFNVDLSSGIKLPVFAHRPKQASESSPVLIVMHGNARDADRYLHQWRHLSDRYGFHLVVPEFSRDQFPKGRHYNLGNVWQDEKTNDQKFWSYAAIEPVFEHYRKLQSVNTNNYVIYGHSAGAQFVHRFLFHIADTRATDFVVANAGWYTLPEFETAWPYGLESSVVTRSMRNAALLKPLTILLGDQDTDPKGKSLRRTPEALIQGPHRFARGHFFLKTAKRVAVNETIDLNWRLEIVPGVGHDNGGMAEAAAKLLFAPESIHQ